MYFPNALNQITFGAISSTPVLFGILFRATPPSKAVLLHVVTPGTPFCTGYRKDMIHVGWCVISQHPLRTVVSDELFTDLGVVNGISPNSQVFISQKEEVKLV